MRCEWSSIKFGDIAEIDMGQSPSGINVNKINEGLPLLNGPTEFGAFHPTPVQWTTDSKKESKKGDILFCVRGSTTGRMNWSNIPYSIGRGLAAIRHKKSNQKLNRYIWYTLKYQLDNILSLGTGSTFPNVSKRVLEDLLIEVPPISTQLSVATILSCLDKKIELNNKINENLEQQAQAIFKSWFVDFEPFQDGKFVESELGMIPEGWEISSIKDISQEVVTGKTPSTKKEENYGDHTMFVTIPDMRDQVYVIQTQRYLSEVGINTQPQKMLPRNSIMVSCIATAGLVSLTSDFSHTNQQINTIIPKEGIDPYFVFLYMQTLSRYINDLGSGGTTTVNLNKGQFSNIKLIIPPETLFVKFNELVEPMFKIIELNQHQNITLANIRNALLPKLMSGEIEVPVE